MATLFFSYSHADENLRDLLERHLSALLRQGIITAWHDRRITAGKDFAESIDENINLADVILLLISPDFIASDYCYEIEMRRAMERQGKGNARVIPVILRPCDWHELPFGKLLAAPKDGRPITKWPDMDDAFLDVVRAIKNALREMGQEPQKVVPSKVSASVVRDSASNSPRSSNLRIAKVFTEFDKDRFRHDGFEYMAKFFENSLRELVERNPGIEQAFRRIDANRFTAAAYRDGKKVCQCSIEISGGRGFTDGIAYSMSDNAPSGGFNESVSVKGDDQILYFEALGMQSGTRDREKLTYQGASEFYWDLFIHPLQ